MSPPRMLLSCLALCLLGVEGYAHRSESLSSHFEEWRAFRTKYDKTYPDLATEVRHLEVFLSNRKYIEEHNALYKRGASSFSLALNSFADLTHEEFVRRMNLDILMKPRTEGAKKYQVPSSIQLPDTVDWRSKGYVTPVKNQGQCGSCWSFSTTGSMEGQHFNKTGKLLSLSEQQLVDCSVSYGNHGCQGGSMDLAFKYIMDKGIESEASYPYTAKQRGCKYNASLVVAKCRGHVDVPPGETALQSAVGSVGPVSVAIDASHRSFQHYSTGVYDEPDCSRTQLDHGVLAVGYGTDSTGGDYWLVKNSWGMAWGQNGYIKMSRNKNNQCGIASSASYPLV